MKRSKKIYLVRHGETDNNKKKILQGGLSDLSINERGQKQASAFFDFYRDIPFQKIYTSELKRSIQSVSLFINHGVPVEAYSELNEISFGIYDGKASSEGDDSLYHRLLTQWDNGEVGSCLEGGESPLDVQKRIRSFLKAFLVKDEDPVLICMHGRAMRIFLATVLNYRLSLMNIFPHVNMGLYVVNYTGSMFYVENFNDCRHLQTI